MEEAIIVCLDISQSMEELGFDDPEKEAAVLPPLRPAWDSDGETAVSCVEKKEGAKRPYNAYMFFCKETRPKIKLECPELKASGTL